MFFEFSLSEYCSFSATKLLIFPESSQLELVIFIDYLEVRYEANKTFKPLKKNHKILFSYVINYSYDTEFLETVVR